MPSDVGRRRTFVCSLMMDRGDSFSASLAKLWKGRAISVWSLSTLGGGADSNACKAYALRQELWIMGYVITAPLCPHRCSACLGCHGPACALMRLIRSRCACRSAVLAAEMLCDLQDIAQGVWHAYSFVCLPAILYDAQKRAPRSYRLAAFKHARTVDIGSGQHYVRGKPDTGALATAGQKFLHS